MNQLQLFQLEGVPGGPVIARPATRPRKTGYAAKPGTGPEGETCKTCAHYSIVQPGANKFRKCGLMERFWTHGPGTDIKASSPACREWKPSPDAGAADAGG